MKVTAKNCFSIHSLPSFNRLPSSYSLRDPNRECCEIDNLYSGFLKLYKVIIRLSIIDTIKCDLYEIIIT